jgi:hypothetical protein
VCEQQREDTSGQLIVLPGHDRLHLFQTQFVEDRHAVE